MKYKWLSKICLGFVFFYLPFVSNAQISFEGFEHLFTPPKAYTALYTHSAIKVDGDLTEKAWRTAAWTDNFVDIEGKAKPQPRFKTRVKLLWNDSCLFIAAELQEPDVWATLKQHDNIIYHDNDFEVFIDPGNDGHQYFEIEVNALNTIMDLFMPKPYRNGGIAMLSYNATGLQSAVKVHGTLNHPGDKDTSWMIEMAIPFQSIYPGNKWRPPNESSLWRLNFSRVEWDVEIVNDEYIKEKDNTGKILPERNWVWSPQGVINMHCPERWGYLQFVKKASSTNAFPLPQSEKRKQYLWLLYYKQKAYFAGHHKYAMSLKDLGIVSPGVHVAGEENVLKMEATKIQFTVYISDEKSTLSINDEGFVQTLKK
jgi:hypothetical protein